MEYLLQGQNESSSKALSDATQAFTRDLAQFRQGLFSVIQ